MLVAVVRLRGRKPKGSVFRFAPESGHLMLISCFSAYDPERLLGRTDRAMAAWYHPTIA